MNRRVNLYYQGRHYDQVYSATARDINFWVSQARANQGPVLELACGTGRITIPIAKEGVEITGLDISTSMLAEAKEKADREKISIQWINGDMRHFDLGKKFPLIFIAVNSICHLLTLEEMRDCLRAVKKHLTPDGVFIIDVFNPNQALLTSDTSKRDLHACYEDPEGRGTVIITEYNEYDSATQINKISLYYQFPGETEEVLEEILLRVYYPKEMEEILTANGFKTIKRYGGYNGQKFGADSSKLIVFCAPDIS